MTEQEILTLLKDKIKAFELAECFEEIPEYDQGRWAAYASLYHHLLENRTVEREGVRDD